MVSESPNKSADKKVMLTNALLFLVIGGYRYLIGGVMQSQREQGKNTIMYAIIGLVLALLSWAIVNTVQLLVT